MPHQPAPIQPMPNQPALPTGTVTFLFSDIEGSTRLQQRTGPRYAAVLADHHALLRQAWANHGGVEIDTAGDGFFVAFGSAPQAVAAAAQATVTLAAHPWPENEALRVRMGLHTGTPQLLGERYVGMDVVRAARIAASGHGGQVLLSQTTRDLAEHELPEGASLRDLSAHRLKDLRHAEHLYQLLLPGLPADFPPLKTLDAHPHNLPVQPTPLLGREDAVTAIGALLRREEVRLVTLTGPGGIGKTRLSIQVAAELVDGFPDGVWLVRLSRLNDPSLVLPAIAQTLGVPEHGGQPIGDTLREYLRARRPLLVLDNFEQVAPVATEVAGLLEASPGLKVLATSRVPLHLRGEREYPLAPLPLPDPAHLPPPDQLSQYAAVGLFVERAVEAQPDFAVTSANAPAIAEICARLDGLPLAIELAAARVKLLAPEALLARLSSRLKLLTGGARDLEERQQTMRATIAWSEGLLRPDERVLFRRLAVFVGGATLEAAEAVCAAPEGTDALEGDVLDGLGTLVDQSLVQRREDGGETRFRMLQVIRDYALEQLAASGEAEALSQAHLAYYRGLSDLILHAEWTTWSQLELRGWFHRIEREYDNFRAALTWAHGRAQAKLQDTAALESGLRLTGALLNYWSSRGHFAEGRGWAAEFLALDTASVEADTTAPASPEGAAAGGRNTESPGNAPPREADPISLRARVWYVAGLLAAEQGDIQHAKPAIEHSLTRYRTIKNLRGLGQLALYLGSIALVEGDRPRAKGCFEESLAIYRELFGPFGGMVPLNSLGALALVEGDLGLAQTHSDEALTLSVQVGQLIVQADSLILQALIALRRGQTERAAALARKGVELGCETGEVECYASGLETGAMVLATRGRAERAARLLGAAASYRDRIGLHGGWRLPAREDIAAVETLARAKLGAKRYTAAFAAGQALSQEDAIAEALKVSPRAADLPHVDFSSVANYRK